MQKLRITIFTLMIMLIATVCGAQTYNNKLTLGKVYAQPGKTSQIPVELVNDDQIVALQFDIYLPTEIKFNEQAVKTNRFVDHEVIFKYLHDGYYRVMIYSPTNQPLLGNKGTLMYFTVDIDDNLEGRDYQYSLSSIVASDQNGENVISEWDYGIIHVSRVADININDLVLDRDKAMPGDTLNLRWTMQNIGDVPFEGSCREEIWFVKGAEKIFYNYFYYEANLAPNETVNRELELPLWNVLHIGGDVKVLVDVVPSYGTTEPMTAGLNNYAESGYITIGKKLYMWVPSWTNETNDYDIYGGLSRSSDITRSEKFNLTVEPKDGRVTVPSSVTIPEGCESENFIIHINDNDIYDRNKVYTITASSAGFVSASAQIEIYDDEVATLLISSSVEEVNEGESFKLLLTREVNIDEPLNVNLYTDVPTRVNLPPTVTFAAGEKEIELSIDVIDNDEIEHDVLATFNLAADGFETSECFVLIKDNDVPTLSISITPDVASESASNNAYRATLTRSGNLNTVATIWLTDEPYGSLFFPDQYITLDKGVSTAVFNIGVNDNNLVDGDREVTVLAAVYISSCGCSVPETSVGAVTAKVTILDDDGPTLKVYTDRTTWHEGSKDESIVITRNTSTDQPLTVHLKCDNPLLDFASEVVIPAGMSSVTVPVTVKTNDDTNDSTTAVIYAEADGFTMGTCWVMISDQTLPDIIINDISYGNITPEVDAEVTVTVEVRNIGVATMPAQTPINIYLSNSGNVIGTAFTRNSLAPGEVGVAVKTIKTPAVPGVYTLRAHANESKSIRELDYANNISTEKEIEVAPTFVVKALTTDKAAYDGGEAIKITGQASGSKCTDADVELFFVNLGARMTQTVHTDANGDFSCTWIPVEGMCGTIGIGACYPGEKSAQPLTEIDVWGLRFAKGTTEQIEINANQPLRGTINLFNPTSQSITGLKLEVSSAPEGCEVIFDECKVIEAGQILTLGYTVKGTMASEGIDWHYIVFKATAEHGVSALNTVRYYCHYPYAKLECDETNIVTTMTKGSKRDYPLTIINRGNGSTGKISVSMPQSKWLALSTPEEMPSIEPGESTTIMLRLVPSDDMPLNVAQARTIGVNCANGEGLVLSVFATPVSSANGTLVVDVCDEFTYNTPEAPHLAGAQVTITKPNSIEQVAYGVTGDDGTFTCTLPEGYYTLSVQALKHESQNYNIIVDPEVTTTETVDLSYSAGISINWQVVPTTVEDVYEIELITEFETNVPVPVVVISGPDKIDGDAMAVGESVLLTYALTNKGMIKAEDVHFILHEDETDPEFSMQPLTSTGPYVLNPQESVFIPVLFTRNYNASDRARQRALQQANAAETFDACMKHMSDTYKWTCGKAMKENKGAFSLAFKACGYAAMMSPFINGFLSLPGGSGLNGGGGGAAGGGSDQAIVTGSRRDICDPEMASCGNDLVSDLAGMYDGVGGAVAGALGDAADAAADAAGGDGGDGGDGGSGDGGGNSDGGNSGGGGDAPSRAGGAAVTKALAGLALPGGADAAMAGMGIPGGTIAGLAKPLGTLIKCAKVINTPPPSSTPERSPQQRASKEWQADFNQAAETMLDVVDIYKQISAEFYGDTIWCISGDRTILPLLRELESLDPSEYTIGRLKHLQPESVSDDIMALFVERIYNFANGIDAPNTVNRAHVNDLIAQFNAIEDGVKAKGHQGIGEWFDSSWHTYKAKYKEMSGSVCASVTLKFAQTVVITREAFRGTLTVYNGNESQPIRDFKLHLVIRDASGRLATQDFAVNTEGIEGFTGASGLEDGWNLAALGTGTANVLFVPKHSAAPDGPQIYGFGGTVTYIDPFTGLPYTAVLSPVYLTVNPSPLLDLTYFMQRDIFGDDPLTPEVIEPTIPAQFALLVNNKGVGDALNMAITTHQPEIISNEKGLALEMSINEARVNGEETKITPALNGTLYTDFGRIPAGSTAYAQWWFTSNILGHFIDYKVNVKHVTDYGEGTSLLDNVTVHELIHVLDVDRGEGKPLAGFLVNDVVDGADTPDHLYMSDNTVEDVHYVLNSSTNGSGSEYILTVTPAEDGWNYGHIVDPTLGRGDVLEVVRLRDGKLISTNNFWQTHCTMPDSFDPIYESLLHFADDMRGSTEEYRLKFSDLPDLMLEVERVDGVPAEETLLTTPLRDITVTFNKDIDPSTFTADDLVLHRQGTLVKADSIKITALSDCDFKLDLSAVTSTSGYYTLTVATAEITDVQGYNGRNGKRVSWVQYIDPTGVADAISADYSLARTLVSDLVEILGDVDAIKSVSICSVTGATLMTLDGYPLSGIDVSALPTGHYIVAVELPHSGVALRFIKN